MKNFNIYPQNFFLKATFLPLFSPSLSFNRFLSPLTNIILCSLHFTSGRGRFTTEVLSIQLPQRTDDRKRNGYSFLKCFSLTKATGLLQSAELIGEPGSAALAGATEVKGKVNMK